MLLGGVIANASKCFPSQRCASFPCRAGEAAAMGRGVGHAVQRTMVGEFNGFFDFIHSDRSSTYDVVVHPVVQRAAPQSSGLPGLDVLDIYGTTFSKILSQNVVDVGGTECMVEFASADSLRCRLGPVLPNSVGCMEYDSFLGASSSATLVSAHDASVSPVLSCQPPHGFNVTVFGTSLECRWIVDMCPAVGKSVRSSMEYKSARHRALCCAQDGGHCTLPSVGNCSTTFTWETANKTCVESGKRLCTKMELSSGIFCSAGCNTVIETVWSMTEAVRQPLLVTSSRNWTQEVWVRCREFCADIPTSVSDAAWGHCSGSLPVPAPLPLA